MATWMRALGAAVVCLLALVSDGAARDAGRGATRFILAASWQPAFCATNRQKSECRVQTRDGFDAKNFSLHGLWPMREDYCDVSEQQQRADRDGDWKSLPDVQLSPETKAVLDKAMPGTQSGLERHEWTKHGTCTKVSPDAYFRAAVGFIDQLNASAVRQLFADNIGRKIDAESIKAAFDESFGPGAGDRVKMSCRRVGDERVISELTIGLSADALDQAAPGARLADLIQSAGRTSFGCNEGVVSAVGH
ncbi:ribonuclease T2 family protein [Rhizobium sp. RAF56]|uniref:ribonuclease T2 family protein n=1 Tax=Rhizobium sp. RAF56 TaxID=3233062 RepID=UPI003F9E7FD8